MKNPKGYLSFEEYMEFSEKKAVHHSKREAAYLLFEKYQRMKMDKNDYDLADYIFHIFTQVTHLSSFFFVMTNNGLASQTEA